MATVIIWLVFFASASTTQNKKLAGIWFDDISTETIKIDFMQEVLFLFVFYDSKSVTLKRCDCTAFWGQQNRIALYCQCTIKGKTCSIQATTAITNASQMKIIIISPQWKCISNIICIPFSCYMQMIHEYIQSADKICLCCAADGNSGSKLYLTERSCLQQHIKNKLCILGKTKQKPYVIPVNI